MTEDQILVVPPNTNEPITQQFTCNATGTPNLEIVWKHKGRLIRRSNEKYSIKTDNVTPNSSLMTLHSVLTIKDPAIIDSGPVTCEAGIRYRKDSENFANDDNFITTIESATRHLIVLGELCMLNIYVYTQYTLNNLTLQLHYYTVCGSSCVQLLHCFLICCVVKLVLYTDTSLEPRPFLTQASDLLVRIDLSEGVEISEAIRVRVRLTPETNELPVEFNIDGEFVGVTTLYPFIPASSIPFRRFHVQVSLIANNVHELPVEFNIDGEFVGVTTLYPFIPASSIPFRRFHVQVSLIANNVQGPFNPNRMTEREFIDLDLSTFMHVFTI